MLIKILLTLALAQGAQAPPAATSPVPRIPESLSALAALLSKIDPTAAVRPPHRRATQAVTELQALAKNWPAESPEPYRRNLAGLAGELEAAVASRDSRRLHDALHAVADDLETKLEHCRKSGGRLGGAVTVRVRTVQGPTEARSWQVVYMPKIFEASSTHTPDVFPQLSSPTEEPLIPGRYVMWVRQPGTAKTGERTVVKVGEGRKELLVDLPVPADIRR